MMVEALADGGVLSGLSRKRALELAADMVRGSGAHLLASGEHPAALKDAVCSPAGTTIAGVRVLERRGVCAFS
jgi:pyrroline-5-carboxylate reductase